MSHHGIDFAYVWHIRTSVYALIVFKPPRRPIQNGVWAIKPPLGHRTCGRLKLPRGTSQGLEEGFGIGTRGWDFWGGVHGRSLPVGRGDARGNGGTWRAGVACTRCVGRLGVLCQGDNLQFGIRELRMVPGEGFSRIAWGYQGSKRGVWILGRGPCRAVHIKFQPTASPHPPVQLSLALPIPTRS